MGIVTEILETHRRNTAYYESLIELTGQSNKQDYFRAIIDSQWCMTW